MSFKTFAINIFSSVVANRVRNDARNAVRDQSKILKNLIKTAQMTAFGKDHQFEKINSYDVYKKLVPVKDYEELKPYIDKILKGEKDVLWPGKPKYLAKTSGTTSGVKYIPISHQSISNHIHTARTALLNYIHESKKPNIFEGKVIFLSGSPALEKIADIPTGRLSGIVYHEIPSWVKSSQLPSWETNCIEDWEDKLESIISETLPQDMRLISGIPPWVQMYYEQLLATSGKENIADLFPNLSLFMYGGVNFEPYRSQLEKLTGKKLDSIETYPASEGFIAFQNSTSDSSLLLNTNSGIYYEFIHVQDLYLPKPERISLKDVQIGEDYALIISSNAGLWAYNIGDTVRFTSLSPFKIVVSGRIKHFISAFGEHVIAKEVEEAMMEISSKYKVQITEFTVAPQVNPKSGNLPYHEWLIEFGDAVTILDQLEQDLDEAMIRQNIYYKDLRKGNILRRLMITPIRRDGFRDYMKSKGKLGGQNKVPRLSNDRQLADAVLAIQHQ